MAIRFSNLDNIENKIPFGYYIHWMKERRRKKKDLITQIPQALQKEAGLLRDNRSDFSITWIGHSTFFIQMNGLNMIADPVWAERMGFQKRLTRPGLAIEELPGIDYVFISHGHYDHLDFGSIKRLKGNPKFMVPAGLMPIFIRKGYRDVIEANWWDEIHDENHHISIHFVPAQHWTRRTPFDTNTSHWGGWIIQNKLTGRSVYFVGDTGYFRGFREIGEKFDIDVVLMPIGAYEPEWFMKVNHINPEDAVKAFHELQGKVFIPMHYGTYRLADDTGIEALGRLSMEWGKTQTEEDKLKVLALGQTIWLK